MDVFQAIEQRRSVKSFDPNYRFSDREVHRLLDLVRLSPTAFNLQHWRFVLVNDPVLRRDIRQAAWDQPQVTDASLFIVICADIKAYRRDPARYWRHAPPAVREVLVPTIEDFYAGKEQVQRDEAMRSCAIAAQTLMLAAKGMGYDTCPMVGFDFEIVADLVNLPADYIICLCVAIGKGLSAPLPRGGLIPEEEVIFIDRFGRDR